jgi:chemotaxis family two-component system response regulator PixG
MSENSTVKGIGERFLVRQLQQLSRGEFNGRLDVQSDKGQKWGLFFCYGRLIWATGGSHPARRWRRILIKHCPEIAPSAIGFRESDSYECWQYQALRVLVKGERVAQKQIVAAIADTIEEVLFDIIQQGALGQVSYSSNQENVLESPLTLINAELALKNALKAWESWCNAGLAERDPNLAPVLRQSEQLRQQLNAAVYKNFATLFNSDRTLRDLAVQMKQDLLPLTRSLMPYVRQGMIGLIPVPDLPLQNGKVRAANSAKPSKFQTTLEKSPLVACVDDSWQTCQMMEQIFAAAGLRFVSIQDSVQALPRLLELKPDLIFLDLIMPVVNGYEICSQLRRVSLFADTPMIILTGSDGLIDRVRAKIVGCSDFLTKPVDAEKILDVVGKYLSVPASAPARRLQTRFSQPTLEMT